MCTFKVPVHVAERADLRDGRGAGGGGARHHHAGTEEEGGQAGQPQYIHYFSSCLYLYYLENLYVF